MGKVTLVVKIYPFTDLHFTAYASTSLEGTMLLVGEKQYRSYSSDNVVIVRELCCKFITPQSSYFVEHFICSTSKLLVKFISVDFANLAFLWWLTMQ